MIIEYKGKKYEIEYGKHLGNHYKVIRKSLQDNHTLIYGKKVWWVYYDYKQYRQFSMRVKYLGKANEKYSWVDVPGEEKPQMVLTKELEVNYYAEYSEI